MNAPRRILETALYAEDLAAAARFYREVIGLTQFDAVEGRHVFFRCGSGVLLVFDPAATADGTDRVPGHGARGPGHVAFAVGADELEPWRLRLISRDVAVESEVAWPGGGRSIYFRDPAGNSLELTTPETWGFDS